MNSVMKRTLAAIALGAATFGTLATTSAYAAQPTEQQQGAVRYISGGIGDQEESMMKSKMGDYSTSMLFSRKAGATADFLADISVHVTDSHGQAVLDVSSVGPYLLADLAPGTYQVTATHRDRTETRRITVGGRRSASASFEWN